MSGRNVAPLIVTAMPSELRHALEITSGAVECSIGPWVRWDAEIDGRRVHLLLTGIGMVNAGAALARALCDVSPVSIVNYGCAGAHRDDIHPGDVVIGDRYVHHRAVTILPDGSERHAFTPISPRDSSIGVDGFDADIALLGLARTASHDWRPDPWHVTTESGISGTVRFGPIASADSWAQSTDHIARIHDHHRTLCEDMEAAALAQVAAMHGVPFLAIKDISNNEFHTQTDHGDYGGPTLEAVQHEVGKRAFALVRRMLKYWTD